MAQVSLKHPIVLLLCVGSGLKTLTEVEEDEFGLDGGKEFDEEGDGDIDDQQHQHDPLQLPHQPQPEDTSDTTSSQNISNLHIC